MLESDAPSYIHRSMAEVSTEMVFHYKGTFDELKENDSRQASFLAGVQGPSDKIKRFSTNESFGIFGVYFYPHAVPLICGIDATELTNQMTDLRALFGQSGDEIEERIMLAPTFGDRVEIMTNFLEPHFIRHQLTKQSISKAVNYVIESHGQVRIEILANRFAMSERQFERRFKSCAGFSPKLFSRIARFHFAMQHFGNTEKSLSSIAHECGYYDQSHFIHEFKQFSGHNPKLFFREEVEGNVWRN
jgi:AraC-like DNA-binding protein